MAIQKDNQNQATMNSSETEGNQETNKEENQSQQQKDNFLDNTEKLQEAASNINIDLTEEEKQEITKNKQNKKEEKEIVEAEDDWKGLNLSKEETKQSVELHQELNGFINKKVEIEQSVGVVETLPTGIDLLDAILGGGFGIGTFSVLVGNPGTFKSSLLGQIIGSSQKKFKGQLLSQYLDSENAMTTNRLAKLGVKHPPLRPYCDVSVEDVFKSLEAVCSFKDLKNCSHIPSIIAWDSIANTLAQAEREASKDDVNKTIGLKARVMSYIIPKYLNKMKQYNTTLMAVNQLRAQMQMGPFGGQNDLKYLGDKDMPGGNAIKFNAFHILLLKQRADIKQDEFGFNGIHLEAKCVKNKLFTPNITVDLIVDFNTGISNFWTNYQFLAKNNYLTTGPWNYLKSIPNKKFRKSEAKQMYDEDSEFKEAFDNNVKEAINTLIIEKYKDEDPDIEMIENLSQEENEQNKNKKE